MSNRIIKRDAIYIGHVAKLDAIRIVDNKFILEIYKVYRSILFMIDDGGLYNEAKYKIGSTKIFDEMKIYMDTINEFGSDKKISTLKKGIRVNLDAFKPSRKEGKVKKKTYAR